MKKKRLYILVAFFVFMLGILLAEGCAQKPPPLPSVPQGQETPGPGGEPQGPDAPGAPVVPGTPGEQGSVPGHKEEELTTAQITERIFDQVQFPEMVELNEKRLSLFYGIGGDDVEDYSVFVCAENIRCDELAVIKAREGSADVVMMGVKIRWEEQMESFRDYLPEQYEILSQAIIKVNGNYVLLAVSPSAGLVSQVFDSCFE